MIEKIQDLDDRVQETENEAELETLDNLKRELEELREKKIQGNILRSKAKWLEKGEKPSGYFLHLENKNYTSKLISRLIVDTDKEVSDTGEILKEQVKFYQKLY